jgi:hypothetical protein
MARGGLTMGLEASLATQRRSKPDRKRSAATPCGQRPPLRRTTATKLIAVPSASNTGFSAHVAALDVERWACEIQLRAGLPSSNFGRVPVVMIYRVRDPSPGKRIAASANTPRLIRVTAPLAANRPNRKSMKLR